MAAAPFTIVQDLEHALKTAHVASAGAVHVVGELAFRCDEASTFLQAVASSATKAESGFAGLCETYGGDEAWQEASWVMRASGVAAGLVGATSEVAEALEAARLATGHVATVAGQASAAHLAAFDAMGRLVTWLDAVRRQLKSNLDAAELIRADDNTERAVERTGAIRKSLKDDVDRAPELFRRAVRRAANGRAAGGDSLPGACARLSGALTHASETAADLGDTLRQWSAS